MEREDRKQRTKHAQTTQTMQGKITKKKKKEEEGKTHINNSTLLLHKQKGPCNQKKTKRLISTIKSPRSTSFLNIFRDVDISKNISKF